MPAPSTGGGMSSASSFRGSASHSTREDAPGAKAKPKLPRGPDPDRDGRVLCPGAGPAVPVHPLRLQRIVTAIFSPIGTYPPFCSSAEQ